MIQCGPFQPHPFCNSIIILGKATSVSRKPNTYMRISNTSRDTQWYFFCPQSTVPSSHSNSERALPKWLPGRPTRPPGPRTAASPRSPASRQPPRAARPRETLGSRDSGAPPSYPLVRALAPSGAAAQGGGGAARPGPRRRHTRPRRPPVGGTRAALGTRSPIEERREQGPREAAAARLVPPPPYRWASGPCPAVSAEPGGGGGCGEARREPGCRPAGLRGPRRRGCCCCCCCWRGGGGPGPLWMVVKMIIENFEALKSWLSKTLEPM